MLQTPVRVEPPSALTGEVISPGWASVETATPLNGARMTVSSGGISRTSISRSATTTYSRWLAIRASSEFASAFAVEIRLSDQAQVQQPALATEVEAGLLVGHLALGQRQVGALGGVVEPGEDMAFGYRQPLLDQHVDDTPVTLERTDCRRAVT